MQTLRDPKTNAIVFVLFEGELCDRLDVTADELRSWPELIPASGTAMHPDRETVEPLYRASQEQLDEWERYARILRTGMSEKQVLELVRRDSAQRKAGKQPTFVKMYSRLAGECPPGITAHAMRSYCTVLLHQNRAGRMLLAKDLAKAAGIPEATAKRHLRYLQAVGLLKLSKEPLRWEFALVPQALSRYYPD